MSLLTIVFGILFIILGVGGFVATGSEHKTALIPAAFGVAYIVCGVLARKDDMRKHAMHGAAMLGLLGALVPIPGVIKFFKMISGETIERPQAAIAQTIMSVLSFVFVALCVRSFIAARRARENAANAKGA